MLGKWEEAARDLSATSNIDYDDETNAVLKKHCCWAYLPGPWRRMALVWPAKQLCLLRRSLRRLPPCPSGDRFLFGPGIGWSWCRALVCTWTRCSRWRDLVVVVAVSGDGCWAPAVISHACAVEGSVRCLWPRLRSLPTCGDGGGGVVWPRLHPFWLTFRDHGAVRHKFSRRSSSACSGAHSDASHPAPLVAASSSVPT